MPLANRHRIGKRPYGLAEGDFLEGDYDEWTRHRREELSEEREAVLSTRRVDVHRCELGARADRWRNPYSEEGYTALIAGHLAAGRSHAAADVPPVGISMRCCARSTRAEAER